jgi:acetoin utilization protein AcuB
MALVSEAMNRSMVTVSPDARIADAIALAARTGTEHLLVLDEENLVGILCTCDLRAAAPDDYVWECMTLPVLTVRPDASVEEAALTMGDCDVGCLPVAVGGLLLGTLSVAELARAGVAMLPAHRHHHHHTQDHGAMSH